MVQLLSIRATNTWRHTVYVEGVVLFSWQRVDMCCLSARPIALLCSLLACAYLQSVEMLLLGSMLTCFAWQHVGMLLLGSMLT